MLTMAKHHSSCLIHHNFSSLDGCRVQYSLSLCLYRYLKLQNRTQFNTLRFFPSSIDSKIILNRTFSPYFTRFSIHWACDNPRSFRIIVHAKVQARGVRFFPHSFALSLHILPIYLHSPIQYRDPTLAFGTAIFYNDVLPANRKREKRKTCLASICMARLFIEFI